MKEWWQNLSAREQLTLLAGSAAAIFVLFFILIWSPFTSHIANLKQDVGDNHTLLQWMQHAEQRLDYLQHNTQQAKSINPADLLSIVDQSSKKGKLNQYVTQIAQADNNKVEAKFKEVPFDLLMKWLTMLWQHYHIQVDQLSIQPKGSAGFVQADVTLKSQ